MNKPVLLLMAPVQTVSGYGARSRDLANALIDMDKFDIKIWGTRWGNTPMNALKPEIEKHKAILDRMLLEPKMNAQPEVFVQVTVPNEFQKIGKYNIGVTAGIETTVASAPWIEGCNRMDLILISSEFSKKVFQDSVWTQYDQNTNQPIGDLKLEKPIEVLLEGVDLNKYFKTDKIEKTIEEELLAIPESFCYLFVGHWLNGEFGHDRKNVAVLIRSFLEAFKGKSSQSRPALILKTSHADFSPIDKENLVNKIKAIYEQTPGTNLPNVYIIHGELTDEEMNSLYNHPKIKAHVTYTKGEGFGRPLAEASLSQKPIIATNWSGHIDFLKHAILLPGALNNVHPSAAWQDVILQESKWFDVDLGYGTSMLRHVFDTYKDHQIMAKSQATFVRKNYSFENMFNKLKEHIEKYVPEFPTHQQLVLPKLKKIELPKLKKVE
jgi:hypothetical protein